MSVNLSASNIPLGTPVQVTVIPFNGATSSAMSGGLAGTVQNSTASASVTVPLDQPAVLAAIATFPITASLGTGPLYAEGEEVTHVRVTANLRAPTKVTYLTASGREVPAVPAPPRW